MMIRKALILLNIVCIALLQTACESDNSIVNGGGSIEVNGESTNIIINEDGMSNFAFTTTESWTVSVIDTSQNQWLTLSQLSGEKGQNSIEMKARPNYDLADRSVYLSIKSGDSEFKIGVLQKMGNGATDIPFADSDFREYCIRKFDINGDGLLSFEEAMDADQITYSFKSQEAMRNLGYFLNLRSLSCYDSNIKEIDLRMNKNLESLFYKGGELEKLDLSQNTDLRILDIGDNKLSSLDLSKNTKLTSLYLSDNKLTELDLSNQYLLSVASIINNELTNLLLNKKAPLIELYLENNKLASLDLSDFTQLTYVNLDDNQLTMLNLANCSSIYWLYCSNNKLTQLDLTASTKLGYLYALKNPNLTEIWVPKNTSLWRIYYSTEYNTEIKFK